MIKQDRLQKIASHDIPGLMSPVRYVYRKFIRGLKFRTASVPQQELKKRLIHFENYRRFLENLKPSEDILVHLKNESTMKSRAPFGKYRHMVGEIRDRLRLGH